MTEMSMDICVIRLKWGAMGMCFKSYMSVCDKMLPTAWVL